MQNKKIKVYRNKNASFPSLFNYYDFLSILVEIQLSLSTVCFLCYDKMSISKEKIR